MSASSASAEPADSPFGNHIFINCPFDDGYRPIFDAIVFAIQACGFYPRSALEFTDGGATRIAVIVNIMNACRLAVHDLSRVELSDAGLPRFNMPLELGLWLGAVHFGDNIHKQKKCLILDAEPFRYQKFISDISGQDPRAHGNNPETAIRHVRDFLLSVWPPHVAAPPGGGYIARRFAAFQSVLPLLCDDARIAQEELTFIDRVRLARGWLTAVEGR